MNVWTFSGRVGADAELRTTQSGEKVLSFRVANDIGFGDRKTTQWVDCSYWGKRAEAVSSYVRKGDKITVSGEVKLEEFQRRDGTPGSKLAVRVNDLDLAARSESGGGGGGGGRDYEAGGGGGGYGNDRDTGSRGSSGGGGGGANRGGGKPAFDQDLDDEIPF
jgi:single-strand DNA-binding protein